MPSLIAVPRLLWLGGEGGFCKAEAATGADLVRGGTVVRIHFRAASSRLPWGSAGAQWEAGEGRLAAAGPRAGVSRVVPALPSWCPGAGGVSRGCEPARRGCLEP